MTPKLYRRQYASLNWPPSAGVGTCWYCAPYAVGPRLRFWRWTKSASHCSGISSSPGVDRGSPNPTPLTRGISSARSGSVERASISKSARVGSSASSVSSKTTISVSSVSSRKPLQVTPSSSVVPGARSASALTYSFGSYSIGRISSSYGSPPASISAQTWPTRSAWWVRWAVMTLAASMEFTREDIVDSHHLITSLRSESDSTFLASCGSSQTRRSPPSPVARERTEVARRRPLLSFSNNRLASAEDRIWKRSAQRAWNQPDLMIRRAYSLSRMVRSRSYEES